MATDVCQWLSWNFDLDPSLIIGDTVAFSPSVNVANLKYPTAVSTRVREEGALDLLLRSKFLLRAETPLRSDFLGAFRRNAEAIKNSEVGERCFSSCLAKLIKSANS